MVHETAVDGLDDVPCMVYHLPYAGLIMDTQRPASVLEIPQRIPFSYRKEAWYAFIRVDLETSHRAPTPVWDAPEPGEYLSEEYNYLSSQDSSFLSWSVS